MARIIVIKTHGEKETEDACTIVQDDSGDFSVDGKNQILVNRVLELIDNGITTRDGAKYDNPDDFMDGLLVYFKSSYCWAEEVD